LIRVSDKSLGEYEKSNMLVSCVFRRLGNPCMATPLYYEKRKTKRGIDIVSLIDGVCYDYSAYTDRDPQI